MVCLAQLIALSYYIEVYRMGWETAIIVESELLPIAVGGSCHTDTPLTAISFSG